MLVSYDPKLADLFERLAAYKDASVLFARAGEMEKQAEMIQKIRHTANEIYTYQLDLTVNTPAPGEEGY